MRRFITITATTTAICALNVGALTASSAPTASPATTTAGTGVGAVVIAPAAPARSASATIRSSTGTYVGTATLRDTSRGVQVTVQAKWLKPGFHGLHLHKIGACAKNSIDPTDASKKGAFLSAGGHWGAGKHPGHSGDLGIVLANSDTRASYAMVTGRFKVADLFDKDGTALMIHQNADNFANIPQRYAPDGPDAETLKSGDGGSRAACGVIRR